MSSAPTRPRNSLAEERELVQRMIAGEERAFEEFSDTYIPALHRFAFFRVNRDLELASEIAAAMRHSRERILICSPVLTSGPILGALIDVVDREAQMIIVRDAVWCLRDRPWIYGADDVARTALFNRFIEA